MLRISLTFSGKRNSVGGGPGLADHVEGNTPGWDHAEYRCRPSSCRGSITHPLPCFSLSRRERPQTRRRDGEHPASKCLENYRTAESSRADGTATALTFVLMSREVMSLTGAGWRPANMTLARSPSHEAGGPHFRDSTHLAVTGRHHPTQVDTTDVALFVALRISSAGKCHKCRAARGLHSCRERPKQGCSGRQQSRPRHQEQLPRPPAGRKQNPSTNAHWCGCPGGPSWSALNDRALLFSRT